ARREMAEFFAMDDTRRIPGGAKNDFFERHAHVQELGHHIELVLHAGIEVAGVNVRRYGIGRESLLHRGHSLAEFKRCAAVSHIEQHAAFTRFEQVRQQSTLIVEHGNGHVEGVRVNVTGAEFLQDKILERALGAEFSEVDHYGNIRLSASLDAALDGSPVRSTI